MALEWKGHAAKRSDMIRLAVVRHGIVIYSIGNAVRCDRLLWNSYEMMRTAKEML